MMCSMLNNLNMIEEQWAWINNEHVDDFESFGWCVDCINFN